MLKKAIGHMACPECAFADAEVKEDKNGSAYRYCPDCNAQYFTRGEPVREKRLRGAMRPVSPAAAIATVDVSASVPVAGALTPAARVVKPGRKAFSMDDLK